MTSKFKIGAMVLCLGYGRPDPEGARGCIGTIVAKARHAGFQWSVSIPGKHSGWSDGSFAARQSDLRVIGNDPTHTLLARRAKSPAKRRATTEALS